MELVRDEAYEEMASTFQCIQLDRLNKVLRDNGIDDAGLRKSICETYLFELSHFLDHNWFTAEDRRVYPALCFADRFLDADVAAESPGTLFAPSPEYSHHEYAMGNSSYYFEEHGESIPDLHIGVVGRESD